MSRHRIITNDDYVVELELHEGELHLHCDVFNYNKDVERRMVRDWLDMEEALYEEGFTHVTAVPQKTGFMELTGWDKVGTINYEGKDLGVYRWELQPLLSEH